MEQPETIKKAYNYGGRIENNIVKLGGLDIHKKLLNNIEYILIIGWGTSYNAGLIGENYLKNKKFKLIKLLNACEFSIDDIPNIENKESILCIFLSQSGETVYIIV